MWKKLKTNLQKANDQTSIIASWSLSQQHFFQSPTRWNDFANKRRKKFYQQLKQMFQLVKQIPSRWPLRFDEWLIAVCLQAGQLWLEIDCWRWKNERNAGAVEQAQ